MQKRMCDFCETREANTILKVKKMDGRRKTWENVDICDECYFKLFDTRRIKVPANKNYKMEDL